MTYTAPPTDGARTDDHPLPSTPPRRRRAPLLIAALAVVVVVVAALVWLVARSDDDGRSPATTAPATTTTLGTAPTTAPSATPTTPATPVPPPAVDTSTAVFPDAAGGLRFTDPVAAARAFAVDFLGFTDPVVGEYQAGDSRSGEVGVRPLANGPVTTVMVRQLSGDTSWWVLGAATESITADAPAAGAAITSPVTVTGTALTFEGNVAVEVRQDGSRQPLGTGYVTGGGDVARPFTGEIGFSAPTEPYGAILFLDYSAEDGRLWQASVIRVAFG